MILDASAILAVLLREPGCEDAALVLSSRMRKNARAVLNEFLREVEVEIISFTRDHYEAAVDAFERYGKGRHAAALNFGDCMTYAVARISGIPLLFTGKDFSKTDISRVRS